MVRLVTLTYGFYIKNYKEALINQLISVRKCCALNLPGSSCSQNKQSCRRTAAGSGSCHSRACGVCEWHSCYSHTNSGLTLLTREQCSFSCNIFQDHQYALDLANVKKRLNEAQEKLEELGRNLRNAKDRERRHKKTVKSLLEDLKHKHMLSEELQQRLGDILVGWTVSEMFPANPVKVLKFDQNSKKKKTTVSVRYVTGSEVMIVHSESSCKPQINTGRPKSPKKLCALDFIVLFVLTALRGSQWHIRTEQKPH